MACLAQILSGHHHINTRVLDRNYRARSWAQLSTLCHAGKTIRQPAADIETKAAAAEPSGRQELGTKGADERVGVGAAPAARGTQGAGFLMPCCSCAMLVCRASSTARCQLRSASGHGLQHAYGPAAMFPALTVSGAGSLPYQCYAPSGLFVGPFEGPLEEASNLSQSPSHASKPIPARS